MFSLSTLVQEIPPLFCQLDLLQRNQAGEYTCWKEKARWIRFEEQAEEVAGRWSKPHVATIPQTAMESLKELINETNPILNLQISETTEIIDCIINSLSQYFGEETENKEKLTHIFNLPHFHHHEKNMEKRLSTGNVDRRLSSNLRANLSSSGLFEIGETDRKLDNIHESNNLYEDYLDFKENTKFRKKVNKKAEGASILVAPLDFVEHMKIVFVRMQSSALIPSFLEVNLTSRFIIENVRI